MKIFLNENVLDAAKARIRWVFSEFKHVYVGFSGGKDSTVVLNLALEVAEELHRLPLPVMFTDQEAEWQNVIDYIRTVMHDPRVSPRWLQVPVKLFNATSAEHPWLHCWEPGKEWIREKEPDSIHRNVYGTDRFVALFKAFLRYHHWAQPAAYLAGVRCEESPSRQLGLTLSETYKGETWGMIEDGKRKHFAFYPLYDWGYKDVWKAIHDHGWKYSKLYDYQYQYGVPLRDMRVSNLHHETAVKSLFYLQEIESATWDRVVARLQGVNAAGHLNWDFFAPRELPTMFSSWVEYRDYLVEHMIDKPEDRAYFHRTFAAWDQRYHEDIMPALMQVEISSILTNDTFGTKLGAFGAGHFMQAKTLGKRTAGGAY